MALELYISQGGKRLRCGYTTGTCAALAAKAAARMLLTGQAPDQATILTPKGVPVTAPVLDPAREGRGCRCAVEKDAGDDADVTNGLWVYAYVERRTAGVSVDGGAGVGRVTRPGLEQPVGAAAINQTPRRMIAQAVEEELARAGASGGMRVEIRIPDGARLAAKTFNPQLGIEGGLSVLGTSGIVEPMSLQALVDTIEVEMRLHAAEGAKNLVVTPGNYGQDFLRGYPQAAGLPVVKCSNFVGQALDFAGDMGFERLLLVGHIGKFVKLAGGVMNTHSHWADCRAELFAAHAALAGASQPVVGALMESATTDACIAILDRAGLRQPVLHTLLDKVREHIERRAAGRFQAAAVLFSNQYGLLGETANARELLREMGGKHE